MALAIIEKILGGVAAPVVDYFKARAENASKERMRKFELKDAIHRRQVALIQQGLHADMNWEMEMAKQAGSSWKDEYTLIVVSIPAVLAFIRTPFLDGPAIVAAGFESLSDTPMWYQTVLVSLFLATVGIRWWRRSLSDT